MKYQSPHRLSAMRPVGVLYLSDPPLLTLSHYAPGGCTTPLWLTNESHYMARRLTGLVTGGASLFVRVIAPFSCRPNKLVSRTAL